MSYEAKIQELGLEIPIPGKPVFSYIPGLLTDDGYVYVSGQLPTISGQLRYKGKVGVDLTEEEGREAAKICALNALGVVKSLIGSLDKVERIVEVSGFVNAGPEYEAHPLVINGASDILGEIFGEQGKHTRIALGASGLPLGAAVEVKMIVKVKK